MSSISARELRAHFIARQELALFDLRDEASFATGHPLFAAQLGLEELERETALRLPRRDAPVVLYDDGEGVVGDAARRLGALGYSALRTLEGGLAAWRREGFELFQDVNSYSKAFGELVHDLRGTPSLTADQVKRLIDEKANVQIVDARRFDEYRTMSIPTATSVPGAELVLRTGAVVRDPETTLVVNCAGRTRSIIGAQSLINAGFGPRVASLQNGTIGWTLAGHSLDHSAERRAPVDPSLVEEARARARAVSRRAGVRHIGLFELDHLASERTRTLYCFDVRSEEEYTAGHIPGFLHAPGGQLVQETDMFAPLRGARIVLADEIGSRADMTASWLAQMTWEVYVLDPPYDRLETGSPVPRPRAARGRYKRPYEGTDNAKAAMQAYLDWEFGLVKQLEHDGTHGFFVI